MNRSNISLVGNTTTVQNIGGGISIGHKTGANVVQLKSLSGGSGILIDSFTNPNVITLYSYSGGSTIILNEGITGATSLGTGTGVYKCAYDYHQYFKSLSGGSGISISSDANMINICSAGQVFTQNLLVSIAAGKTFGKYLNGDTIPASGKTANQVIQMAIAEALVPTVNLSSSSTNVVFGLSAKTVNLIFSYTINTIGAGVVSVALEWRRGGAGSWSGLTTNTGVTTYNHTINDSGNRFNTAVINYKYTVTDSASATTTTTYDVTPQAYSVPTYSLTYTGSVLSYETQTSREKGNISTTIDGSLCQSRSLVSITKYQIQRCVNGSGFTTIATCTGPLGTNPTITTCLDSGAIGNATSIGYRIAACDDYCNATPNYSSIYTINLQYASYYGYCTSTSLTGPQICALGNQALLSSRARTMVLTAPAPDYTYVSYPASFGDLTNAIMDGAAPVLGAFTKLTAVSVINGYGQAVSNNIYKSNIPGAFTANSVAFS
jgi:hypothetical protein